ncbi:MAG TPA: vWA domain-containing protein, partial [Gaiellaceae bacterium]
MQARAGGTSITSGPMGSGYDIRIVANVSDGTNWESTSWTTGGVTRCVNHDDEGNGTHTVDLEYQYEANAAIKAAESPPRGDLPDPGKVGPSEHVFPPPPGGASPLRVELFTNDNCSGSGLASQTISLTTDVPATNKPLTAACQGLKVAVILDESGSIGSAAPQVRNATKALARGLVDTGARMAVFKFSTTADPSFIAPYKAITQAWIDGNNPGDLDYYLDRYDPGGTTNWDAGLRQARDQTASDKPDLVVFLTDGNPNRWAGGGTGVEEGFYSAMKPAAEAADLLKANSHMFAIGVGEGVTDALSALRIQAVSGTR